MTDALNIVAGAVGRDDPGNFPFDLARYFRIVRNRDEYDCSAFDSVYRVKAVQKPFKSALRVERSGMVEYDLLVIYETRTRVSPVGRDDDRDLGSSR